MQPALSPSNEWEPELPLDPAASTDQTPPSDADQATVPEDPIAALAAEAGWVDKERWTQSGRDPNAWVPADQHLRTTIVKQREAAERARDLKQQARQATRAADDYARRLERLEHTTGAMIEQSAAEARAQVKAQYEAAKKAAAREGDDERYALLDREQDQVLAEVNQRFAKPAPEPDATAAAQQMLADPVVGKFWRDHPWVAEDEGIYEYAYAIADRAAAAGKSEPEQIMLVKQMLREEFPEKFQTQRRQPAPVIDQDGEDFDAPRDPQTGQFVPRRDAAFYQNTQPMRRPPPNLAAGSRTSQGMRANPEAEARRSLPPEAVRVFEDQKAAGRFKGDIVSFAKIYRGENSRVIG